MKNIYIIWIQKTNIYSVIVRFSKHEKNLLDFGFEKQKKIEKKTMKYRLIQVTLINSLIRITVILKLKKVYDLGKKL